MERLKNEFLSTLAEGLGSHQKKDEILKEYELHLDELLVELYREENESDKKEQVYSRLGTPEEIAGMWRNELSVTPSNMRWLFISLNTLFFAGGSTLTIAHNLYNWSWLSSLWQQLTSIPVIIALVYLFFWALLGYEIGRGFGHKGMRLMKKTFILALLPNLALLVLTVFRVIPHHWFSPLLTETFIGICIFLTLLLYPVCWIGYRWGKKASI